LTLARQETVAAEQGNFEDIMEIVTKRSEISSRLEVFQHQIANLRRHLEENTVTVALNSDVSRQTIEIANLIIAQDQKTRLLLTDSRANTTRELASLEKSNRGTNAYLRAETKGLSYTQNKKKRAS
jgi:ABC-type Fe3+-citrate transport system substrate-binding protein